MFMVRQPWDSNLLGRGLADGVHGWVPAPWWLLATWATSLHATHRGLDNTARGRQCPSGVATNPLASWGAAAPTPGPMGQDDMNIY